MEFEAKRRAIDRMELDENLEQYIPPMIDNHEFTKNENVDDIMTMARVSSHRNIRRRRMVRQQQQFYSKSLNSCSICNEHDDKKKKKKKEKQEDLRATLRSTIPKAFRSTGNLFMDLDLDLDLRATLRTTPKTFRSSKELPCSLPVNDKDGLVQYEVAANTA